MQFSPNTTVHGFEIDRCEELPEIDGRAVIGRHAVSGARLLILENDDNDKSFAIGFRTPPKDDTGVFHILEHSVLCGSRKFPVKEPFVDLLKSSMQTFLNAMTFADKTLYPVASTNEQDLFNLMDVYLDAVFHPRIYEKRAIFEQEGWHYELRANDAAQGDPAALGADETTLIHNGVVFNEMKGALSDSASVLYDELQAALFPGSCYAFESGGTPEAIPTLTYEEYLDEHRRHYRTDNSYIILYGNLDADRALAFLDEEYLTPVAAEQAAADEERASSGLEPLRPRKIVIPARSGATTIELPQLSDRCGGSRDECITIDVPEGIVLPTALADAAQPAVPHVRKTMDTALENAVAGCGYVIGESSDRTRAMAAEILLDALFGSNESPLKRKLLDRGVAHDIQAYVSDALLQPFAVIQASMPAPGAGAALHATIAEAVRELLSEGLDHGLLDAALAHAEFVMREHDMGYADGVVNSMMALSSWLYDDDAPLDYLRYESAFATLRAELEGGYFEELLSDLFCAASAASVEIVPTPGESDDAWPKRLAEMNERLSREERTRIVAEEAVLREMQEAPDDPEATAALPRLSVADIGEAPDDPAYGPVDGTPVPCVRHMVATRGIAYATRYFDMGGIAFEDLPYASVLALVLGKLDTARHSAVEIDTLSQGKLGNLSFYVRVLPDGGDPGKALAKFVVGASALSANTAWLADLPREIMMETDFSDAGKILDVLKQRKITAEQNFANAGHSCATARLKSYYTAAGVISEQVANVGFYRFLCDLIDNFDERRDGLVTRLEQLAAQLFCDDACIVSFAGSDADFDAFWAAGPLCGRSSAGEARLVVPEPRVLNEAFVVPSDVCYAALGWDRRLIGAEHSGHWMVASRALSYDYLWNEVRVKGGAYGVGFQESVSGNMRFYSYRDPHLDDTLARFADSVEWLGDYSPSEDEFDGFIVATTAKMDAPAKPRAVITRQMGAYFGNRAPEYRQMIRQQVVDTTVEDVRALAAPLKAAVDAQAVCVFGNREILEGSQAGLDVIPLVG